MIRVTGSGTYLFNIRTRMPFRYGIAELTETPHLFCAVELDVDGARSRGIAADSLVPKWFTKNPDQSYEDEIAAMLTVIEQALTFAPQAGDSPNVFSLWQRLYQAQEQWAAGTPHPPLLWNFGVSLVERAIIDAFCRATQTPFAVAVRQNSLGIDLGGVYAELAGFAPADLLPAAPGQRMFIRHTVGLSDHLAESDLPVGERLQDGLPQTLEASIAAYGLRYFKIKVNGDDERDLARLTENARIIAAAAPADYAFTLDGNEQYYQVEAFRRFWAKLMVAPGLSDFTQHLLFVEQPFARAIALSDDTRAALRAWPDRPPMIIDESDADLQSLSRALECGYQGTSHKNCKGVFKGLANACLLAKRRREDAARDYLLSGEDLANVGPVALLQDLAVMATLGLQHVERNGHHYFAGLGMFPKEWQQQILAAHPDLFRQTAQGWPALKIENGAVSLQSVLQAPFGIKFAPDLRMATPRAQWQLDNPPNSPTPPIHDIQNPRPTRLIAITEG